MTTPLVLPAERQLTAHCYSIKLHECPPAFMERVSMIEKQQGITKDGKLSCDHVKTADNFNPDEPEMGKITWGKL